MKAKPNASRIALKRKLKGSSGPPRKKVKVSSSNLEDLPWKTLSRPMETGLDGDDGILDLEEVEGVEIVYEETENGKVARFKVMEDEPKAEGEEESEVEGEQKEAEPESSEDEDESAMDAEETLDFETQLPEWQAFGLTQRLGKSLLAKEAASLPHAMKGRDIGSGKTLAPSVIAPTRELALQVTQHLDDLLKAGEPAQAEGSTTQKKPPPHVSVAAIVGGMSAQKQRRRLWDIIGDDDTMARELRNLKFLVLDEADRMIEAGHFVELENILRLTLRESTEEQIPGEDNEEPTDGQKEAGDDLQTFHDLLMRLDFRDPEPEIIDLSPQGNLISTLQEGRINCLSTDKDAYLYYFFLRYPGRSLVFLSSIDGIRRLLPLMELLNIKAFPLHSQLEQRTAFKSTPNAVLLATDIAARGLDIPAVDHVIHFQIPRTADTYVHRNGRTARANRKGFSMLMCAPEERRIVKALMHSLKREENEIEEIDVEMSMLDKLKDRVVLARQIETSQHKVKKVNHDRNWMKEAAETLGVDLDSDYASNDDDEDNHTSKVKKMRDGKIKGLKAQLKQMLATPIMGRGVSAKFITSGSRPIVNDLIAGQLNDEMIGVKRTEAGSEMLKHKKRKRKSEVKAAAPASP
ncbi:ATP-dependent RNA helicase [Ephemerocybe angulata]|uniref:ATP-dependent RNA helicase n=1 Tax=Ephemerocybe angulata TaxID=980116 RepID=A0A8H6HC14_9AGAR|nr:ATP-dependent RNA helicase [Tulosesus angulatus]